MIKCTKCNIEKDESAFSPGRKMCRKCRNQQEIDNAMKKNSSKQSKKCISCEKELSIDNFETTRNTCRKCRSNQQKQTTESKNVLITKKVCTNCNIEHNSDMFEATRKVCKNCRKTLRKESSKVANNNVPNVDTKPIRCVKCNELGKEFKWRTDTVSGSWRNECNDCFNKHAYYKTYREKKIAEDHRSFRDHNNQIHNEYIKNNPHYTLDNTKKRSTDIDSKMNHFISSCKTRNIFLEIDDIEKMKEKLSCACNYCGYTQQNPEDMLNGLDRIDNSIGYTDENTVTACNNCNIMRNTMSIPLFIKSAQNIVEYRELCDKEPEYKKLCAFFARNSSIEKVEKNVENLPENIRNEFKNNKCYLCGNVSHGIDRVDSSKNYEIDNVAPCCSVCNYMKKNQKLDDFLNHVLKIYKHNGSGGGHIITEDEENNKSLKPSKRGPVISPIAFYDKTSGDLIGVFQNMYLASEEFSVSTQAISRAILKNILCSGYNWKRIDKELFHELDNDENKNKIILAKSNIVHKKRTNEIAISIDGNIIQTFASIADATRKMNISQPTISNAIKNKTLLNGYYWNKVR